MAEGDPIIGRFNGGGRAAGGTHALVAASDSGALARRILADRQEIGRFFDARMFVNPALDILLTLFAAAEEGARVSVSGCCAAAGVPRTTALRWIAALQAQGMVREEPDPLDRRRRWVMLSDTARASVMAYLDSIGT